MRVFILLFLALFSVAACTKNPSSAPATKTTQAQDHDHDHDHEASAVIPAASGEPGVIDVYMTPTCGCCGKWVAHLEENGFKVNAHKVQNTAPVKLANALPRNLGSCHTALVEGYVVEGHVPASVVKRMLAERPKVKGIAVPRMPIGSPGMEGPNPEPYDVIAYTESGETSVYEHVPVN